MAGSILKRRQAVIWLPPRAIGERSFGSDPVLRVALPGVRLTGTAAAAVPAPADSASGGAGFDRLSLDALPPLERVTLVFDARDVNLLRVSVPPLSAARTRQAIPHLVEESLLQDASSCAWAIGPRLDDGQRVVAVLDRAWMEFVLGAFARRGMRVQAAWPAQLAVPFFPGTITLACLDDVVILRTGPHEGSGWGAGRTVQARTGTIVQALAVSAQASSMPVRALVLDGDEAWQQAILAAGRQAGVTIDRESPPRSTDSPIDLLSARTGTAAQRWLAAIDWRVWRWPALALTAALVVALAGLNLHWMLLARESSLLQAQIEQRYRDAFPTVPVIVDPVLQMRRSVAELQTRTGRAAADDFLPLLARFSDALGEQAADALTALDYRAGRLQVRFRSGLFAGSAAREALVRSMRQSGLTLRFEDAEPETRAGGDAAGSVAARAGARQAWHAVVALQP